MPTYRNRDGHCRSATPRDAVGFTLVELLVVIGIIAVLIGILLPALSRARKGAAQTACLSNIKQLAMAGIMYASNNKGAVVPIAIGGNAGTSDKVVWTATIDGVSGLEYDAWNASYVSNSRDLHWSWKLGLLGRYLQTPKVLACPAVTIPDPDRSYTVLNQQWIDYPNTNYGLADTRAVKTSDVRCPSDTAMFVDAIWYSPTGDFRPPFGVARPSASSESSFQGRHPGNCGSVAFFDGHAEPIPVTLRPGTYRLEQNVTDAYNTLNIGDLIPRATKVTETTPGSFTKAKPKYDYYFLLNKQP